MATMSLGAFGASSLVIRNSRPTEQPPLRSIVPMHLRICWMITLLSCLTMRAGTALNDLSTELNQSRFDLLQSGSPREFEHSIPSVNPLYSKNSHPYQTGESSVPPHPVAEKHILDQVPSTPPPYPPLTGQSNDESNWLDPLVCAFPLGWDHSLSWRNPSDSNNGHTNRIERSSEPTLPEPIREISDEFHPTAPPHLSLTSYSNQDLPEEFRCNSAGQVQPATERNNKRLRQSIELDPPWVSLRGSDFDLAFDKLIPPPLGCQFNSNNGHTDQTKQLSIPSQPESTLENSDESHRTRPSHLTSTSYSNDDLPPNFRYDSAGNVERITERKYRRCKRKRVPKTPAPQLQKVDDAKLAHFNIQGKARFSQTFKLVDFQPETNMGRIAVDAIMGLRGVDGKNLFDLTEEKKASKMIQLVPTKRDDDNFFASAFQLMHTAKEPNQIIGWRLSKKVA